MKILISGGGIAGLALAALLEQRGINYKIIEKATSYGDVGYILSLWPLGSRVLFGLHLWDLFLEKSIPLEKYSVLSARGRKIVTYNFSSFSKFYGSLRTISRAGLLEVLLTKVNKKNIFHDTTVSKIHETENHVEVEFSDNTKESFDLVVGCDGINSAVRKIMGFKTNYWDTNKIVLSWWMNFVPKNTNEVHEIWLRNTFFGVYPALGNCASVIAVDKGQFDNKDLKKTIQKHLSMLDPKVRDYFGDFSLASDVLAISLMDAKVKPWGTKRTVLLGDAAAPFLPSAGVGASMALESAAVLADELSRVSEKQIPAAVANYIERRVKRVDAIQNNSRSLLHLMMIKNSILRKLRDFILRFMSDKTMLRSIVKWSKRPI